MRPGSDRRRCCPDTGTRCAPSPLRKRRGRRPPRACSPPSFETPRNALHLARRGVRSGTEKGLSARRIRAAEVQAVERGAQCVGRVQYVDLALRHGVAEEGDRIAGRVCGGRDRGGLRAVRLPLAVLRNAAIDGAEGILPAVRGLHDDGVRIRRLQQRARAGFGWEALYLDRLCAAVRCDGSRATRGGKASGDHRKAEDQGQNENGNVRFLFHKGSFHAFRCHTGRRSKSNLDT